MGHGPEGAEKDRERTPFVKVNKEITISEIVKAVLMALGMGFAAYAWTTNKDTNDALLTSAVAELKTKVGSLDARITHMNETVLRTDERMRFVFGQMRGPRLPPLENGSGAHDDQ